MGLGEKTRGEAPLLSRDIKSTYYKLLDCSAAKAVFVEFLYCTVTLTCFLYSLFGSKILNADQVRDFKSTSLKRK